MKSRNWKPRKFTCSECKVERRNEFKGLQIGTALFNKHGDELTQWYCRFCSRKMLSIYGTNENLDKCGDHINFTLKNIVQSTDKRDSFWVLMANSMKKLQQEYEGKMRVSKK